MNNPNAKHTPGPWIVENFTNINDPTVTDIEIYGGSKLVAEIKEQMDSSSLDNANARLIAAAPELLEALRFASTLLHEAEQLYGFRNAVQTRAIEKLLERIDGDETTGGGAE